MSAIQVLRAGLPATLQDLGRPGHQRYGIGTAGAMDLFALQVANLLAGNPRGSACLELAVLGPVLRAQADLAAALGGADLGARLGGRPLAPWRSFRWRKDEELRFAGPARGAWAYLAVSGGFSVAPELGSRSTDVKAGLGGWHGRPVAPGDVLPVGSARAGAAALAGRALAADELPAYTGAAEVRVVPGPQEEVFGAEGLAAFFGGAYEVTPQSDRMGYRLRGPAIPLRGPADILSEATARGSVQVPAGGQPIVLLADGPTTGGYPKIATVCSVDLPRLAQLQPRGRVVFRACAVDEARELARARERFLVKLQAGCGVLPE